MRVKKQVRTPYEQLGLPSCFPSQGRKGWDKVPLKFCPFFLPLISLYPPSFLHSPFTHTVCKCSESQGHVWYWLVETGSKNCIHFNYFQSSPQILHILTLILVLGLPSHSGLTHTFRCLRVCPKTGWPWQLPQETLWRACSEICKAVSELSRPLPCFRVMMAPRPTWRQEGVPKVIQDHGRFPLKGPVHKGSRTGWVESEEWAWFGVVTNTSTRSLSLVLL